MIRYKCQACGAHMVSSSLEAGTTETCPRCGKPCVVPSASPPSLHKSSAWRAAAVPAAFAGLIGIGAGVLIAFAFRPGGGAAAPVVVKIHETVPGGGYIPPDRPEGERPAASKTQLEAQNILVAKEIEASRQAAQEANVNLAGLLADANFVYMPAVTVVDANDLRQLAGIRKVSVEATTSTGIEPPSGVSDMKRALESALGEAGFTIDAAHPDAAVICHVTLVPFQGGGTGDTESESWLYCRVECGVSRQAYIPGAKCEATAIVWLGAVVGIQGPEELPRGVNSPRDAASKATTELVYALRQARR